MLLALKPTEAALGLRTTKEVVMMSKNIDWYVGSRRPDIPDDFVELGRIYTQYRSRTEITTVYGDRSPESLADFYKEEEKARKISEAAWA